MQCGTLKINLFAFFLHFLDTWKDFWRMFPSASSSVDLGSRHWEIRWTGVSKSVSKLSSISLIDCMSKTTVFTIVFTVCVTNLWWRIFIIVIICHGGLVGIFLYKESLHLFSFSSKHTNVSSKPFLMYLSGYISARLRINQWRC